MSDSPSIGGLLREARVAKGLSQELLAAELKLPLRHLHALESDQWEALPPGRERPMARQIAERLGVDLEPHGAAMALLPGGEAEAAPDPRLDRMERVTMGALGLGSVALLAWLLIPGPSLRPDHLAASWLREVPRAPIPPPPPRADVPYPVLGEMLPEAPRTEQGLLLNLRAQDACEALVEGEGGLRLTRTLRVSDPWRLRVKGPFRLSLSNAGVVKVDVAGAVIPHGAAVGAAWTGRFDAEGRWLRPPAPKASEVAPEVPPGGESGPEGD